MSKKKIVPLKDELQSKYLEFGSSISSLAREYNTSNPTVRKWLIEYDIERKDQKTASTESNNKRRNKIPSKKVLMNIYENNSLHDTYAILGIGQETLYQWLNYYNIDTRTLSDGCKFGKQKQFGPLQFDKNGVEAVYRKYKHMGFAAKELGISYSHLKNLMKRYGIKAVVPWRSKGEIDLFNRISSIDSTLVWNNNDKKFISPFEIDIINHEKKIAIEYCGLYWHSEYFGKKSDKMYHQKKFLKCLEKGYQLITVFENDDIEKVMGVLNSKIGMNKRIFAKHCYIRQIDSKTSSTFHKKYHLHNNIGGSVHYGLYHDNLLLIAITVGKSRFNSKYEWECGRMTCRLNYTVIGGASKLFKHFFNKHNVNSCITYADLRFGMGKVYENCGFEYKGITKPNYWYFHKYDTTKLCSRVKFQKHKLKNILTSYDARNTEYENMIDNGWDRIWDCGNAIWVYHI